MSKKDFKPKSILVIKYRALGDSIMGISSIKYIRELYPNSIIYYALPKWITPLYKNIETPANRIIPFDLNTFFDWPKMYKQLKVLNIDLIYEMHQSGRTSTFFKFYTFFNNVRYYFHNHHLKSGTPVLDQGVIKSLIQRDLDGVYSHLSSDKKIPHYLNYSTLLKLKLNYVKKKQIIFGVVATRETKMWPLEHFNDLANFIYKHDPEYIIVIPLSESKADQKIESTLINLVPSKNIQIVKHSLEDLPKIFSESKLYIGNDTGLKHLAIAMGIKSFTLFGPEPPTEWHPYDKLHHPYFYIDNLECRTRTHHYCGLSSCETMVCLKTIKAKTVFDQIKKELLI